MPSTKKAPPRGGLYLYRGRKPHAPIGLPIIGRHNVYGGMTNSHKRRDGEHLYGSRYMCSDGTVQEKPPASWSDLDVRRYVIPLPDWMFSTQWRRKWIVESLETLLLAVTCPVYNERQQAPWNFRKISRAKAARMRVERDSVGPRYSAVARFVLRWFAYAVLIATAIFVWTWVR